MSSVQIRSRVHGHEMTLDLGIWNNEAEIQLKNEKEDRVVFRYKTKLLFANSPVNAAASLSCCNNFVIGAC